MSSFVKDTEMKLFYLKIKIITDLFQIELDGAAGTPKKVERVGAALDKKG
jgi:hypothetical protein